MFPLKACIRRSRNALSKVRNAGQRIVVSDPITSEASLWFKCLPILHGVPITEMLFQPIMDTVVTTDASNWGFGCFWPPHWYLQAFHPSQINPGGKNNISDRELLAIHWTIFNWDPAFSGKRLLFFTDKKYSKDINRNDLIREIMVQCALFHFAFYIDWTARDNKGQSKNYVVRFVVGKSTTTILNHSENVKNGIV